MEMISLSDNLHAGYDDYQHLMNRRSIAQSMRRSGARGEGTRESIVNRIGESYRLLSQQRHAHPPPPQHESIEHPLVELKQTAVVITGAEDKTNTLTPDGIV